MCFVFQAFNKEQASPTFLKYLWMAVCVYIFCSKIYFIIVDLPSVLIIYVKVAAELNILHVAHYCFPVLIFVFLINITNIYFILSAAVQFRQYLSP